MNVCNRIELQVENAYLKAAINKLSSNTLANNRKADIPRTTKISDSVCTFSVPNIVVELFTEMSIAKQLGKTGYSELFLRFSRMP